MQSFDVVFPANPRGSWRLMRSTLALGLIALLSCLAVFIAAEPSGAQPQTPVDAPQSVYVVHTIRSESPRETLETFRRLMDRLEEKLLDYLAAPNLAGQAEIVLLSITRVPAGSRARRPDWLLPK